MPEPGSLQQLAHDLPALWDAPTTTARDRKRLLRTLIADVTVRHGEYFPKGTSLAHYTLRDLTQVEQQLNERPPPASSETAPRPRS